MANKQVSYAKRIARGVAGTTFEGHSRSSKVTRFDPVLPLSMISYVDKFAGSASKDVSVQ